jgi:hypothetical protein
MEKTVPIYLNVSHSRALPAFHVGSVPGIRVAAIAPVFFCGSCVTCGRLKLNVDVESEIGVCVVSLAESP